MLGKEQRCSHQQPLALIILPLLLFSAPQPHLLPSSSSETDLYTIDHCTHFSFVCVCVYLLVSVDVCTCVCRPHIDSVSFPNSARLTDQCDLCGPKGFFLPGVIFATRHCTRL